MIVVIVGVALLVGAKFGWLGAALVGVFAWLAHSWYFPLTGCWWCQEKSKRRNTTGRSWHNCLVCGGSGKQLRVGARLLRRGLGKL